MEYEVNTWETISLEGLDKAMNNFIETEVISVINVSTSAYWNPENKETIYIGTLLYKPKPI
jgi:hypothetical protein